jgi:hypothetical protein
MVETQLRKKPTFFSCVHNQRLLTDSYQEFTTLPLRLKGQEWIQTPPKIKPYKYPLRLTGKG